MEQTQYQSMGKGCEGILPQGKVKKDSSDLQKRQANSFQVPEKSARKRIEAWKKYLTQKVAVPNLFSLTLIRLRFLKVVFPRGVDLTPPPFTFQEELI